MLKRSVGTLLVLFGLAVAVFAVAFVEGPMFYWADPFEAPVLRTYAIIVGATSLLLGVGMMILRSRRIG